MESNILLRSERGLAKKFRDKHLTLELTPKERKEQQNKSRTVLRFITRHSLPVIKIGNTCI